MLRSRLWRGTRLTKVQIALRAYVRQEDKRCFFQQWQHCQDFRAFNKDNYYRTVSIYLSQR